MRSNRRITAFLAAALVAGFARPGYAQTTPVSTMGFAQSPLFARMAQVNKGLRTYRARVHLDAAMSTFPFLHPELDGNAYFKQPDRGAVVFDSVPAMASLFKKVFPRLPAPAQWPALYKMDLLSDSGGISTVRLVPRKEGRVGTLDVTIDDAKALPTGYTYSYRDGGSVHFNQHNAMKDGYAVVEGLDGQIDLPSVKADAKASFTNYKINVPVSDADVNGSGS